MKPYELYFYQITLLSNKNLSSITFHEVNFYEMIHLPPKLMLKLEELR